MSYNENVGFVKKDRNDSERSITRFGITPKQLKTIAVDACQVFTCNALLAFNTRAGIAALMRFLKVLTNQGYILNYIFFGNFPTINVTIE